jgi:lysophospholipase L1-like esterase
MKKLLTSLVLLALLSFAAAQTPAPATAAPAVPPKKVDASAPIVKADAAGVPNAGFIKAHESFLARGKSGPIDLLFIGDSITAGWAGKDRAHIWEAYYGKNNPANFGIGGDQTQHVIWRIENGELDGITPKVTVLMLGTNNSAGHTAAEIAAANKKIVELIRAKIPGTKVLLLAIFPRGARKDNTGKITEAAIADATKRTEVINAVNAELAKLDDGKNVHFLDINAVFLGQDGKIPFSIMPDQLHPNAAGYQLWADAMKPTLTKLLAPAATAPKP